MKWLFALAVLALLVAGPRSRKRIAKCISALQQQAVTLPSPMRMLVPKWHCEYNGCHNSSISHWSIHIGLLLCQSCVDDDEKMTIYYSHGAFCRLAMHPRQVCILRKTFHFKMYAFLRNPFYSINGQHNGPILSNIDLKRLVRKCGSPSKNTQFKSTRSYFLISHTWVVLKAFSSRQLLLRRSIRSRRPGKILLRRVYIYTVGTIFRR
jgi:hypothetical protein